MRGLLKNLFLAGILINPTINEKPKEEIKGSIPDDLIYSIENELLSQIGNTWEKIYIMSYNGNENLTIKKDKIKIEYFGKNLSNSRLKPHVYPKSTNSIIQHSKKNKKEIVYKPINHSLGEGNFFSVPVILSTDSDYECNEIISFEIRKINNLEELSDNLIKKLEPLELKPGDKFQSVIRIKHDHFLYGKYNPLLGTRIIDFDIGPGKIHDEIVLDKEFDPIVVLPKINQPLEDRIVENINGKRGRFLYLEANTPGYQYYRFDDMPVRFGDRLKISFWYLIALNTEGRYHTRVMEYKDAPNAWYRLPEGFDERLVNIGKWTRFEREFDISNNTTTIALDFRIVGADVGNMWVDLDSLNIKNLSENKSKR